MTDYCVDVKSAISPMFPKCIIWRLARAHISEMGVDCNAPLGQKLNAG